MRAQEVEWWAREHDYRRASSCVVMGTGERLPVGWGRRVLRLGKIHDARKEPEQAVEWYTKGAEAGLPGAMYNLGCALDAGSGAAVPDYPAAAEWYRRAAEAGDDEAANSLCTMYHVGRGRAWQIPLATFFVS